MTATMTMRKNIVAPTRGRPRRQAVRTHVPGLTPGIDDGREVDVDFLDGLLHDLGEEESVHASPAVSDDHSHSDSHSDSHSERRASAHDDHDEKEYAGYHGDIPDIWMMKGGKAPLLTSAQEIVLAKRVERGDHKAREELLNANVRLVASVARRYLGRGLPLEDLMQEGMIGLIRAIEKYNYRKGYRFSTYATHWIRQAVSRALANQGRSIRLPAHVVDAIGRVGRVKDELFHKLGRLPTRQEVADAAGMTEKKLSQLLKNAAHPVSLEAPIGPEGESRLGDFLQADEESSPAGRAFRHLVHDELEHALNSLTPREKEVIQLRYGLGDEDPHTLEETGRRLHITRERARQIEGKAMEKLRHVHITARLRESV